MNRRATLKSAAIYTVIFASLLVSSNCFAEDPFSKLGRGVANVLTGWIEVPKNIYQVSTEQNGFAGVTLGLAKGVGAGLARTGGGAYEAVSFPVPMPEGYKPVVEPEYVF